MGPNYSEDLVDKIYDDFMQILKDKYRQQNFPPNSTYVEIREERNKNFKNAIRLLVELDSWESF